MGRLRSLQLRVARLSAEFERELAAVSSDPGDERNFDREEIACLLRWSHGYTQARIVQAHKLVDDLPQTLDALSVGDIGPEHARALACLLYTSPSPRDRQKSRMPSSA